MTLRAWITERVVDLLNKPVGHYEQRGWNDFERLKAVIRKGDILLVEGDQRVSQIIKLLTHSSWSHAAIYVGDEIVSRPGELAQQVREKFGDEAEHLLVEALTDGVVASPLSKYVDFNVRLCRPHRLHPNDLAKVLDDSICAIGYRYDTRNVVDLFVHLLRGAFRARRRSLDQLRLGSSARTEVICTSLLGRAFHRVRFPVLPEVTFPEGHEPTLRAQRRSLRAWLRRRREPYSGRFRRRHPTLLTPRDFDLSPYFEIVKFNLIEGRDFDYHRIEWEADPAEDEVA